MRLRDDEKAMLDGERGAARQRAMDLLLRYAHALGCDEFVNVTNVAGVPGQASLFLDQHFRDRGSGFDTVYSLYDLDSDDVTPIPAEPAVPHACHLQGGTDPESWAVLGHRPEAADLGRRSDAAAARHGIKVLKTCTPYLAGFEASRGEHCAWMESSAVVYCNSVLGARTNTEGRESTSAALLTGKIPNFGLHLDDRRAGTHRIDVTVPVDSVMDWGLLGYYVGELVQERIPVLTGIAAQADLVRHKHFGAAAASSGGTELYHIVGQTPEAPTLEAAFAGRPAREVLRYGPEERRRSWEMLNQTGRSREIDYVMLGCPHAAFEQLEEAASLLAGRRIHSNCALWIFTSRAVKARADTAGLTQAILAAGGQLLTDTCSAIGQAVPPGTRVVALDSAKQAHYLPAIMNLEAWFGTTQDCIEAALSGRWRGTPP
jgi:predicted aconitase